MARKALRCTFLTPVDEFGGPSSGRCSGPYHSSHISWHYKHLKVPEQTGSAYREKGKPQRLSHLGKLGFPQSPTCCRGQRGDLCTGLFRNEAQPKANPSVSHCLEFSCSPARAATLPGLQGKYSKVCVAVVFSLAQKPSKVPLWAFSERAGSKAPGNPRECCHLCPCFGAACSFLRMVQELNLAQTGLGAHVEEPWLSRGRWAQGNHSPDAAGKQTFSIEFWFYFENYRAFQGEAHPFISELKHIGSLPYFFWVERETQWVMAG